MEDAVTSQQLMSRDTSLRLGLQPRPSSRDLGRHSTVGCSMLELTHGASLTASMSASVFTRVKVCKGGGVLG